MDGVCEGVDPFLVVLREATGDAGVTKSRVDDPVVSAEVLKARRSGTAMRRRRRKKRSPADG